MKQNKRPKIWTKLQEIGQRQPPCWRRYDVTNVDQLGASLLGPETFACWRMFLCAYFYTIMQVLLVGIQDVRSQCGFTIYKRFSIYEIGRVLRNGSYALMSKHGNAQLWTRIAQRMSQWAMDNLLLTLAHDTLLNDIMSKMPTSNSGGRISMMTDDSNFCMHYVSFSHCGWT